MTDQKLVLGMESNTKLYECGKYAMDYFIEKNLPPNCDLKLGKEFEYHRNNFNKLLELINKESVNISYETIDNLKNSMKYMIKEFNKFGTPYNIKKNTFSHVFASRVAFGKRILDSNSIKDTEGIYTISNIVVEKDVNPVLGVSLLKNIDDKIDDTAKNFNEIYNNILDIKNILSDLWENEKEYAKKDIGFTKTILNVKFFNDFRTFFDDGYIF